MLLHVLKVFEQTKLGNGIENASSEQGLQCLILISNVFTRQSTVVELFSYSTNTVITFFKTNRPLQTLLF